MAEFLEGRGGEPARIAVHWHACGRWADAGRAFTEAATRARRASRMDDAQAFWSQAIEAFDHAGDRRASFEARLKSVDAALLAGGLNEARQLIDRLTADASCDVEVVQALTAQAHVQVMAGQWQAARETTSRALALAEKLGQPKLAISALTLQANALSQLGQPDRAAALLQSAKTLVETGGTPEQRYEYLAAFAHALNLANRPQQSADMLRLARDTAQAGGELPEVMACTSNLAVTEAALGHIDLALDNARLARALLQRLGEVHGLRAAINDMNLGFFAAPLGLFDEAIANLESAVRQLRECGSAIWICTAENHLAATWIALGQFSRASRLLAPMQDVMPATTVLRRAMLVAKLARISGGDVGEALRSFPHSAAAANPRVALALRLELSHCAGSGEALSIAREVKRESAALGLAGIALSARVREVECLTTRDPETAADLASGIVSDASRIWPADGYLPELWLLCGRAMSAAGRHEQARTEIEKAASWIKETSSKHVPSAFQDSFLNRNPINRQVLEAVRRSR